MSIPAYWKSLDEIRTAAERCGTEHFHATIRKRLRKHPRPFPDDRSMMRHFGAAIAYSQGARSNMVAALLQNPVFEEAFAGFNPERLARMEPSAVRRAHWGELKCIRYRKKVDAIIDCAKILVRIRDERGSFGDYLRSYRIPRRLKNSADVDRFWRSFEKLLADLRHRKMPFFRSTTSLLQLLLDLDYDSVKPDLIVMRLARRIGMVQKETGDSHLREAVRKTQEYSVSRGIRASAMDWYLLAYGGQTEAGQALKTRFCPGPGACTADQCRVGAQGLCQDFRLEGAQNLAAMKVYLAGPIFQCEDHECIDWREAAKLLLDGIQVIDPMVSDYRGKTDENCAKIVEQDKADIDASDVVLVNYVKPSAGTAMEMLYARERGRKVFVVCGDDEVSPWIRYHAKGVFKTLGEAVLHIRKLAVSSSK